MEEKKLTDEELKQAFFILRHGSSEGLSEYIKAVLAIESEYDRQKAKIKRLEKQVKQVLKDMKLEVGIRDKEIERLTEENKQLKLDNKHIFKELKEVYKELENSVEDESKAVKDTAREIYGEIDDNDILVVETQEYGEIEVVPIERLKEIFKSKGVEVE